MRFLAQGEPGDLHACRSLATRQLTMLALQLLNDTEQLHTCIQAALLLPEAVAGESSFDLRI